MKTQSSKPSPTKARYTEEYKQEALELWRNVVAARPKSRPSWVSEHRCSILAPGPSDLGILADIYKLSIAEWLASGWA